MTQIYLISPPKIELDDFLPKLNQVLATGRIPIFQMRLKGYSDSEIINIGYKLFAVCRNYGTNFIINDRFDLACIIGANGVHIGFGDGKVMDVRKKVSRNFLIGVSCYDSKKMALESEIMGADYVSFGSFFSSKTKNSKGKPDLEILEWAHSFLKVPVVAIGGIDNQNCVELIKHKADFLAIISYIWDHEQGPAHAIELIAKNF